MEQSSMRLLILTHQAMPRHLGGTEWLADRLARDAMSGGHDVRLLTHVTAGAKRNTWGLRRSRADGIEMLEMHSNTAFAEDPARAEYDDPFAAWCMEALLQDFPAQAAVAFHGMKLSASVLQALQIAGIPLIVVLTDFWFLCPNHSLLRWDDSLCRGPRHALDCVRCVHRAHRFLDGLWQESPEPEMWESLTSRRHDGTLGPRTVRELSALEDRPCFLMNILNHAHAVVALTAFARDLMIERGVLPEKLRLLPHAPAMLVPESHTQATVSIPVILMVGPVSHIKGAHVIVEALKLIPEISVEVHCYGNVPQNTYGESIREAAIADRRFQLKGLFSQEKLPGLLAHAAALVAPALWYENGPLAVKSALAAGVPVVASAVGCFPELRDDEHHGLLVARGDADAWAQALKRAAAGDLPRRPLPQIPPEVWSREILNLLPSMPHD